MKNKHSIKVHHRNNPNCKVAIIRDKDGNILSRKGNMELALFHKELLRPVNMNQPKFKLIEIKER